MSVYWFNVPIKGEEVFAVEASSEQEALEKASNYEYHIGPELQDVEWDFGSRSVEESLYKCISCIEKD